MLTFGEQTKLINESLHEFEHILVKDFKMTLEELVPPIFKMNEVLF